MSACATMLVALALSVKFDLARAFGITLIDEHCILLEEICHFITALNRCPNSLVAAPIESSRRVRSTSYTTQTLAFLSECLPIDLMPQIK